MNRNTASIVVVVLVVVIVGGLVWASNRGSNNNDTGMNMNTSSTPAASTQPGQSQSGANAVSIDNFAFNPTLVTVKKGTTVTWTNNDSTSHTVTADDTSKGGPDSSTLEKGKTYSYTFNTAGTYTYHCKFHGNMKGTVEVTE